MTADRERMHELNQAAHTVKTERQAIRRRLHDAADYHESRRRLADMLDQPPAALENLPALTVLGWVHRMQERTATRMLAVAGATPYVKTGQLTARQRSVLARVLRGRPELLTSLEQDQEIQRWANTHNRDR